MKKLLCVILATIMMVCIVPFTAIADTITQDEQNNVDEEEYIYYSDLFYGYSSYLTLSQYLSDYSDETQQMFYKIYSDYMDSPMFIFSDIKHSLPLVFNIKEYTKLISDLTGLTSYTYENALDKANIKFLEELMGESTLAKTYGNENKWVKNINKFLKVYDEFEKNFVVYEQTDIQIYEETFKYFVDNGAFSYISVTNIELLKEIVLPEISEITKILSKGSDALNGAQTLMVGLMIEDVRACIIEEVLASQQKDSTLYDGMSRLQKQLSNGFVSYFYYNYIEEELLGEVEDFVVKKLTEDTIYVDGGFKLIGAIVDVACYVVFDVAFDVPDIDDLTTQAVLTQYSRDFYYLIRNKTNDFSTQFSSEDICVYETLFVAYQAATNAAFNASEKITLSSNIEDFNNIKTQYYQKDVYPNYIDEIKKFIKDIPKENRRITNYGEWIIKSDTLFSSASDTIENGKIYSINGCFNADIKIYYMSKLTVPEDTDVTINGNITHEYNNQAKLVNNGNLTVNGNIDSVSSITNSGKLEVLGNIHASNFYMSTPDASLILSGDLILTKQGLYNIKEGSVILNGTKQQTVECQGFHNLYVNNPAGIKYNRDTHFTGEYLLNSNPLENSGYYTHIRSGDAKVDSVSDYKDVIVHTDWTLDHDMTAEIKIFYMSKLTVLEDTDVTINGNITHEYNNQAKLVNNGNLTVNGNIDSVSSITNSGKLEVLGNIHASNFYMSTPDASLILSGDLILTKQGLYNIKEGSVILNGTKQQTVTNLKAPTIIIENESEEGVVFNSKINPSILFDHRGNNFTLYNNGTDSTFVDYDGDGLKDNVDPEPTIGEPCVITIESEDTLQGTVSIDTIDTTGGTKHTIIATPTFKYHFVKWVNSAGITVSTSEEYTFVAKNDETFTAVFEKRSQNITVNTEGGVIKVPSSAEIESEVIVTVIENDGYVYTEGSLAYNGFTIENDSFIMPDETVTLTAEFVRNDNYFALNEVLTDAKGYTYQAYSKESFANLTNAINVAEAALVNNITAEESKKQIALLQAAMSGLEDKYIVSITLKTTPTLYLNVPDMINDISILVTYDNGTAITVSGADCTIEGFDASVVGEQSITITYGGVSGIVDVIVGKRVLSECTISDIVDQIYDGIKEQYTQVPNVTYSRTGEVLSENIDFMVTYYNNSTVGNAKIVITGIGNYTDSVEINFNIYCEHIISDEWSIDVLPTAETAGIKSQHCEKCDKSFNETELSYLKFSGASLTLYDNLTINYKVDKSLFEESGYKNPYVKFVFNGMERIVTQYRVVDDKYIFDFEDIVPNQMNDIIYATLYAEFDGVEFASTTREYSVSNYCYNMLQKYGTDEYSKFRTLLVDLLNYGEASQVYTNYNLSHLVTENLTDEQKMWATNTERIFETVQDLEYKTIDNPIVQWKGGGLNLQKSVGMRFKISTDNIENLTVKVTNDIGEETIITSDTFEATDGGYYVFFEGLNAGQMSDVVYLTVYDGGTVVSNTIRYSIESYAYAKQNSSDTNLAELVKAMMKYGDSAKAYIN